MSDDPLHRLKSTTPPPAGEDARARALQAAMLAYDEAGRGEQKIAATKGSRETRRPITIFGKTAWRWIMEKRMLMGTVAAGVLLFPLAAQLVWQTGTTRIELPLPRRRISA